MAIRHWFDGGISKAPLLRGLYWRNSARLKKAWCLALHRAGLLKPTAFVMWLATRQCNFQCPFCEASAGAASRDELTTAEAKALIGDLASMRVRKLLISGGEPMLRKDLPELLAYATARSVTPGLISNGSLVANRWEEFKPFRYFLFMTSIDGLPASHDQMRRAGSFAAVMRALDLFASIGTPLRVVKSVVHTGNLAELPGLAAELERSGATDWSLTPAFPVGRAAGDAKFAPSGEDLRTLLAFVRENRRRGKLRVELAESHSYLECLAGCAPERPFFCGAGLTRCTVMPNGDVLPCGQAYETVAPEGNIRETPLSRLWARGFTEFRRVSKPAGCNGCEHWAACLGGCWAERQMRGGCLKDVFEEKRNDANAGPDSI
jgi:radical SAM protein with 4Fe4S-binding SPASM domain